MSGSSALSTDMDGRSRGLSIQPVPSCRPLQPGHQELLQAALQCYLGSGKFKGL